MGSGASRGPSGVPIPTAPGSPFPGRPRSPGSRQLTPQVSPARRARSPSRAASGRLAREPRRLDQGPARRWTMSSSPSSASRTARTPTPESRSRRIGPPRRPSPAEFGDETARVRRPYQYRGDAEGSRPYHPAAAVPASRADARTTGTKAGRIGCSLRLRSRTSRSAPRRPAAGRRVQPAARHRGRRRRQPARRRRPAAADARPRAPARPPGGPGPSTPTSSDPEPPASRDSTAAIDEAGRMKPAEAAGLAGILVPIVPPMNETEAAGFPRTARRISSICSNRGCSP